MDATPTLREVFEAALLLPPEARARLLAERCPDPVRRADLERMLAADADAEDPLPAGDAAGAAEAIGEVEDDAPSLAGSRIGPFELLEVLGEGGSSTVFRAFREVAGVRQYVAVKLLARGIHTVDSQRSFRHEREALARLRHPGIARLIEGGVADNGLAYIALELIDGVPITQYAEQRNLSERQRLRLFLQVCRAVESAHRALIVHRDLKPSNVLVTDDGEVKLLDFGIAKLLDDTDEATRTRHRAMTPAYAAPEQFAAGPVTTATDVFALGVLLHELLTGERGALAGPPESPRFPRGRARAPTGLAGRSGGYRLPGDLRNIIATATAAEPEQRYGSGGTLGDDIERWLGRLPVQAHAPSHWYRVRKFLVRHRGGVAITAALLLALLASLSVALWQAEVARHEAQHAAVIRDFVVELLEKTAPDVPAAQRPDIPTLVYAAAKDLPLELQDQPDLRAQLLYTLGNVLRDMGDLSHSEALLRNAESITRNLPVASPTRVGTEVGMVRTLIRMGDLEGAEGRMASLLAIPPRNLPRSAPREMLLKIAMVIADQRRDMTTAVARGQEMLKEYRVDCAAGRNCDEVASATHDLASVLLDADKVTEARGLADEALARKRGHATPHDLADTLELQSKIALYRGDLDAAEADAREADAQLESLGNGLHRKPLDARTQLAYVLLAKGRADDALALASSLVDALRARGAAPCDLAENEVQEVRALILLQRAQDAVAASVKGAADAAGCHGSIHEIAVPMADLEYGRALVAAGNSAKVEGVYRELEAHTARTHVASPLSWPLYLVESMRLAGALGHTADVARDARMLITALDRAESLPAHPWRLEAQLSLARTSSDPATRAEVNAPAFDAALASIRAWPVGVRLAQERASLRGQPGR